MASTLRILLGVLLVSGVPLLLSSCGGGGAAGPIPQYIELTNGRVVVEQGDGVVIIRKDVSQLPGVGFDQDVVTVSLYRGDGFANPRTDTPSSSSLLRTFRVSRDGTLLDDLQLPEGRYTAVAENIRVVQEGKEFRSALTAYVFDVFPLGGTLRTTLPTKFGARFPALGSVIENSYVAFLTDAGAAGGTSRLFVQHANGTVDMTRTFIAQTEADKPVAAVSFEALPGGPALGNVSRLILKALKP
jgi:hypothetical protein